VVGYVFSKACEVMHVVHTSTLRKQRGRTRYEPIEKAVFSLTRAILVTRSPNGVHIVRLRVASPGNVHDVGVRSEWELAGSVPETAQSIRMSPTLTITRLFNYFHSVTIRLYIT